MKPDLNQYLLDIQAESSLRRWCLEMGSLERAWEKCDRADWMLHLLENSGHPDPLQMRQFTRDVVDRFLPLIPKPNLDPVVHALQDGWDHLDSQGRPQNLALMAGARATVESAAELAQAVGNWTAGRIMLIAAAALHDDPMVAARGTSEQAGMAAQYIHAFPTATDWPDEMACQADCLRQNLGNPFSGL